MHHLIHLLLWLMRFLLCSLRTGLRRHVHQAHVHNATSGAYGFGLLRKVQKKPSHVSLVNGRSFHGRMFSYCENATLDEFKVSRGFFYRRLPRGVWSKGKNNSISNNCMEASTPRGLFMKLVCVVVFALFSSWNENWLLGFMTIWSQYFV